MIINEISPVPLDYRDKKARRKCLIMIKFPSSMHKNDFISTMLASRAHQYYL
jgi:hypothetical protein